jgi:hypothetical protein
MTPGQIVGKMNTQKLTQCTTPAARRNVLTRDEKGLGKHDEVGDAQTEPAVVFIDDMLRMIHYWPFLAVLRSMDRKVFGLRGARVQRIATMSFAEENFFLDQPEDVHFYDNSIETASTDGWFGEVGRMLVFEFNDYLPEAMVYTQIEALMKELKMEVVRHYMASPKYASFAGENQMYLASLDSSGENDGWTQIEREYMASEESGEIDTAELLQKKKRQTDIRDEVLPLVFQVSHFAVKSAS